MEKNIVLPEEYWVLVVGFRDQEDYHKIHNQLGDGATATATWKYWGWKNGKYKFNAVRNDVPTDSLPIIDFQYWKDVIQAKGNYKSGDWVTCTNSTQGGDAGGGWEKDKTFQVWVSQTRETFGVSKTCVFPDDPSKGNGVFSDFLRFATLNEIDQVRKLPVKKGKAPASPASYKSLDEADGMWKPGDIVIITGNGCGSGNGIATNDDVKCKIIVPTVHLTGHLEKKGRKRIAYEILEGIQRGAQYWTDVNAILREVDEDYVSLEQWKIGDHLPKEWLATQLTYTTNRRLHKAGFISDRDRVVKEVDQDGWAHISETCVVWVQPKHQCMPIPEWKAGDRIRRTVCPGGKISVGDTGTLVALTGGYTGVIHGSGTMLNVLWDNGNTESCAIKYAEKISTSNNQSSINNQKTTQNVNTECSSRSTGSERSEQIIVSGHPEEPSFERGCRKAGSPGQSGGQSLTIVRGHKGYGKVFTSSEESSY
jgi:hypothetical protein